MKTKTITSENTQESAKSTKFVWKTISFIAMIIVGVPLFVIFLGTPTPPVVEANLVTVQNSGNGWLSFAGLVLTIVGLFLTVFHLASKHEAFAIVGISVIILTAFTMLFIGAGNAISGSVYPQQAFCENVQGSDSEWDQTKNGFECSVFNEQTSEADVAKYRMKLQPGLSVDGKSVYKMYPVNIQGEKTD